MKTLLNKMTLILILMGISFGMALAAPDNAPLRTVKVEGQGIVEAQADEATIKVSIQEEGDSLKDVVARAKEKMSNLLGTLKSFNVSERDIKTTQYSVRKKTKYIKDEIKPDGYSVTNELSVVLKDITHVGDVLGAVSDNGAQVEGFNFGFSKPDQIQLESLKTALESAHSKAEVLAKTAGAELGRVISIEQKGVTMPTIRPMGAISALITNGIVTSSVPVEQGTDQVTAQVEVVYFLK
jgi:uncharacterized protein YggE